MFRVTPMLQNIISTENNKYLLLFVGRSHVCKIFIATGKNLFNQIGQKSLLKFPFRQKVFRADCGAK
jgi:hypothetical protein